MGLFDIFRRHKKHEDKQEEHPQQEEAKDQEVDSEVATTSQSTSSKSVAQEEATEVDQDSSATADVQPQNEEVSDNTTPVSSVEQTAESASAVEEETVTSQNDEPEEETPTTESSSQVAEVSAPAPESEVKSDNAEEEAEESTAVSDDETVDEESTAAKYDQGLEKSRTGFGARLNRFLANFRHVDEDFFDDLEDLLIESDVGYDMAMKLSDELREEVKLENAKSKQEVSNVIIEKMVELYDQAGKDEKPDLNFAKEGPTVIMFVGVNGAGKTTTIGKMAALFKSQGKKVLLAAADTFRAGATEQLDVWAKRDGVDIVTGPENGDPAAVVFDAVQKAKRENYDILFVDTAGRLQNKVNLMKELAKMKRILTREIPDAPHEVLLVLDATTGQNALNQAKLFKESTDVTGIVLTKLDGTARGGIVLAIRNELHLPVKYVGLGEKVTDLQKFDASEFVYGLFKDLVEVN
ncbi:signal recognition particle-docking protein FtsY [Limosilactobacillus sp. c11Ua_112_M]|uniref:signal recognition particle-docking protein FtsY n=1 Tax=Limosilactobacillus TaxID=2742598 RepID=UPI00177BC67E|nr:MULTISPECIES: signal recognition particle-docking protein FtsY [Limosilactobacillus]MBD8087719.1 signal recognition particle-docking protein FtsY [Limosilactobacillus portuensis]MEC4742140.1 signal recognition particle-docking protein FtsY [Limosilactobacillus sp. c10Ua_36]